jgi:hypothetical protein
MSRSALAEAAAGLEGTRFRLQGRDPATGLDCVGVLAAALVAVGRSAPLPKTYRLRTSTPGNIDTMARDCGLRATVGGVHEGDVLLVHVSACQFHLLIALGPAAFVHAHAGLRRVVRHDGPIAWPVIGHWHLPDEGQV